MTETQLPLRGTYEPTLRGIAPEHITRIESTQQSVSAILDALRGLPKWPVPATASEEVWQENAYLIAQVMAARDRYWLEVLLRDHSGLLEDAAALGDDGYAIIARYCGPNSVRPWLDEDASTEELEALTSLSALLIYRLLVGADIDENLARMRRRIAAMRGSTGFRHAVALLDTLQDEAMAVSGQEAGLALLRAVHKRASLDNARREGVTQ